MPEIEMHNHDANGDPPVTFATDDEIEIADRLRHQLEERYLAPSERSPRPPAHPCNGT